ncbi:DUF6692 family protein [Devosia salina]|uniref:DUF305 domain-containing protein n=1 Tax=Devosia salina TaxID=2860336 RepID=A0ABX8WI09_9HYPH|nr:DUF6692 family protein [Devosia salina]QYO76611.1 DUF305 domain-containing protein [Devosia salina]
MKYGRFFLMIATSTVVMFGLMYLNTYLFSHVFWSETRAWMALVMGGAMAVIMLAFMLSMYKNTMLNIAIFAGAAVVFGLSLWLVRSQVTVDDSDYMSAMIPHHSIAIMTSSRARIEDGRVRKLADEIIYAQDKEISEMKYLLASIAEDGKQPADLKDPAPLVDSVEAALASADVSALDPQFLAPEDISAALPEGAICTFFYTEDSQPALAIGTGSTGTIAVVKLSGDVVRIEGDSMGAFAAGDLSLTLAGRDGQEIAELMDHKLSEVVMELRIGDQLQAGYLGYLRCQ